MSANWRPSSLAVHFRPPNLAWSWNCSRNLSLSRLARPKSPSEMPNRHLLLREFPRQQYPTHLPRSRQALLKAKSTRWVNSHKMLLRLEYWTKVDSWGVTGQLRRDSLPKLCQFWNSTSTPNIVLNRLHIAIWNDLRALLTMWYPRWPKEAWHLWPSQWGLKRVDRTNQHHFRIGSKRHLLESQLPLFVPTRYEECNSKFKQLAQK